MTCWRLCTLLSSEILFFAQGYKKKKKKRKWILTHSHKLRCPSTTTDNVQTSSCSSCSRIACKKARRSYPEDFWSNMPAWMTFWSTFSLYFAAARIFSSTLLTVHKRSTRTSFCWPMRCALSWACKSCRGAQKRCSCGCHVQCNTLM